MKKLFLLGMALLLAVSILPLQSANACACKCADLAACTKKCSQFFNDPVLQASCNAGCMIACWYHGTA